MGALLRFYAESIVCRPAPPVKNKIRELHWPVSKPVVALGAEAECVLQVAPCRREVAADDMGALELATLAMDAVSGLTLPGAHIVAIVTHAVESDDPTKQLVRLALIAISYRYRHGAILNDKDPPPK